MRQAMNCCLKCGAAVVPPGTMWGGMQCPCWKNYAPNTSPDHTGAREWKPLTEDDVRRIVRDEIQRNRSNTNAG